MVPKKYVVVILGLMSTVIGAAGCARSRVVTISTIPPDATLRINDRAPVKGPVTETFGFSGDRERHLVQAQRDGYRAQVATITADSPSGDSLVLEMKPVPRLVTFSVQPMPAIVKLDGKPLSAMPVSEVPAAIEFRVDAAGRWSTHKVTVEREGFKPLERVIRYEDTDTIYKLDLEVMRKNLDIVTLPDKAQVFINDELLGESPIHYEGFPFPVDRQTDAYAPQKLRIEKPGYVTKQADISWEGGKTNYEFTLEPQRKTVRIKTEPPGATVKLGGVEMKPDAAGVHSYTLDFDLNEAGKIKSYSGIVERPKSPDSEWEPQPFTINWDEGKEEYTIKLKEILVRRVDQLRFRIMRGGSGWSVTPERSTTMAMKDESDGPDAPKPVKITRQPRGTMISNVTASPDGAHVLFTVLSEEQGALRSRLLVQRTDGSAADTTQLNDGMSLEVTPSYTPDGSQVVFASNRAGRRLSIWSIPANDPQPVPEQLTAAAAGDGDDLWPSVDSNPQPRLFYESRIDTRPEPRLFARPLGAGNRKDLTVVPAGCTQPRVAPTADAVLFAVADPKTRKRDVYRMSDLGKDVTNLTNTPEVDEFDAVWSPDGQRVAYVSDVGRGKTPEGPDNFDIWLIDAAGGTPPVRVTRNPGWDDSPAWDASGRAIYFRSNRGGEWNVWRTELK